MEHNIQKYVNQLTEKERKVFAIAKEHLGSSFNIQKSNGYKIWSKQKKNK